MARAYQYGGKVDHLVRNPGAASKKCPACRLENPDFGAECERCGTNLSTGAPYSPTYAFEPSGYCARCGVLAVDPQIPWPVLGDVDA